MLATITLAAFLAMPAVQKPRHAPAPKRQHIAKPVRHKSPTVPQPPPQTDSEAYGKWLRGLFNASADALSK